MAGPLQPERKPHVVSDEESRQAKAEKIERILGAERLGACGRMLEVGTGSGRIAAYFGRRYQDSTRVFAVDVADNRATRENFEFVQVEGTKLPFDDDMFDVVITNHVIEHVGDEYAQLDHLREISRVLSPNGTVYFAVPNRWTPFEAHFRLFCLSWLPQRLADLYVRLAHRGSHYDCRPLGMIAIRRIIGQVDGILGEDVTLRALSETVSIERSGSWLDKALNRYGLRAAFAVLFPLLPTYVHLLRKGTLA